MAIRVSSPCEWLGIDAANGGAPLPGGGKDRTLVAPRVPDYACSRRELQPVRLDGLNVAAADLAAFVGRPLQSVIDGADGLVVFRGRGERANPHSSLIVSTTASPIRPPSPPPPPVVYTALCLCRSPYLSHARGKSAANETHGSS